MSTRQTTEQQQLEKEISEEARKTPGLTFGYIGNFERWGDTRLLYIWVEGQRYEGSGNTANIWSQQATSLARRDRARARMAINIYRAGWKAGQASK